MIPYVMLLKDIYLSSKLFVIFSLCKVVADFYFNDLVLLMCKEICDSKIFK